MTAHKHRCRWCAGPRVIEGSITARILDVLEEDASQYWWTATQLADRLGRSVPATRRRLSDLKRAGLIHATRSRHGEAYRYRAKQRHNAVDRSWPPAVTYGYLCSCGQFIPDPHRSGIQHVLPAHHAEHVNPGLHSDRRVS